jgi:hypothetical protein
MVLMPRCGSIADNIGYHVISRRELFSLQLPIDPTDFLEHSQKKAIFYITLYLILAVTVLMPRVISLLPGDF